MLLMKQSSDSYFGVPLSPSRSSSVPPPDATSRSSAPSPETPPDAGESSKEKSTQTTNANPKPLPDLQHLDNTIDTVLEAINKARLEARKERKERWTRVENAKYRVDIALQRCEVLNDSSVVDDMPDSQAIKSSIRQIVREQKEVQGELADYLAEFGVLRTMDPLQETIDLLREQFGR
ncbi:hypothetical protein M011DRAFT_267092 [Sporormia fimetaria CBS 119925]|uniref:Uncharacterized protein n=1 Tax=Sporormia fimetaria CBS 119925 TaxID=1340428 RepID=A0A6A6UYI3_9PLEO|nr:hypothetical protein M011DRAFT_267092 [Sporormia fimetaria CBS 119925]